MYVYLYSYQPLLTNTPCPSYAVVEAQRISSSLLSIFQCCACQFLGHFEPSWLSVHHYAYICICEVNVHNKSHACVDVYIHACIMIVTSFLMGRAIRLIFLRRISIASTSAADKKLKFSILSPAHNFTSFGARHTYD